ncbi:MAG: zf-HC2 domain-containing protein [Anaerolineales bacterium]|nr:zf-HC2 domain-containing protein [Anaerolineales bacterium]
MNHEEQLIRYAANQLNESERADFEKHMAGCASCQADLTLWQSLANEVIASDSAVPAPVHLADSALEAIHAPSKLTRAYKSTAQLLRMQLLLMHNELWIGSAALMFIFLAMALLVARVEVLHFFVPMIAAGTVTLIYGAEHDPAAELTFATPISPWKILLARLTLVSAYNVFLALCATAGLLLILPPQALGELLLGWLAPMTFLSALALLLSLWIGTSNALFISYTLWAAQYLALTSVGEWFAFLTPWLESYRQFWNDPALLFIFGFALVLSALWSAGREQVQWRRSIAM